MTLLSDEHKEAINKTIIERLSLGDLVACSAQVSRFENHLLKMKIKAKNHGWGKRGSWPGDADRTYEDICYYISQYGRLKNIPAATCEKMVKGFKAGMSCDDAIKAFASN